MPFYFINFYIVIAGSKRTYNFKTFVKYFSKSLYQFIVSLIVYKITFSLTLSPTPVLNSILIFGTLVFFKFKEELQTGDFGYVHWICSFFFIIMLLHRHIHMSKLINYILQILAFITNHVIYN